MIESISKTVWADTSATKLSLLLLLLLAVASTGQGSGERQYLCYVHCVYIIMSVSAGETLPNQLCYDTETMNVSEL